MSWSSSARRGLVVLSLSLVVTAQAEAGDWFRRGHGDCNKEVVRLPAQEIRVETSRPRVIVSETRHEHVRVGRALPSVPIAPMGPVVATFFAPVSPVPVTHFSGFERAETYAPDRSAFRAMQDLELQAMEVARLQAAHRAEVEAMNRMQQRVASSMTASFAGIDHRAPPDQTALREEISKLAQRVTNLEKTVLTHDNLLKEKMAK